MAQIIAVTGQAGTGKTTWLMRKASELAPTLLTAEHQTMLAITRMHGSRRRLLARLRDLCPSIPCSVRTIDGFAHSIVNRWRTALGHTRPIQPVGGDANFTDTIFGIEAGFVHIVEAATRLLHSVTIRTVLRKTHPLVMIDELQDCHGPLLEFVKAIAACSTLLLAADDFQFLESGVDGCPAVDWIRATEHGAILECVELADCHRTSNLKILDAARCLRDNVMAASHTVPVICCPSHGPAGFKIIHALVNNAQDWRGTTALICPCHDEFLYAVLNSCNSQLTKKNRDPLTWFHESSTEKEQKQLRESLGISTGDGRTTWCAPITQLSPVAVQVMARTERFSRLRGIETISQAIVGYHVDAIVHERRAYGGHTPKRIVTTVHGAKNREFDNVIILWPYKVPSNAEQRRRLLYNAVTRSKRNCMVLVRGNRKRAAEDSVLSLLGPAEDAFPPRRPKKQAAKTKLTKAREG